MLKRLTAACLPAICFLGGLPALDPIALAGTALEGAIATLTPEQQAKLKAYEAARIAFLRRTDQYWRGIELKRKKRKAKLAAGQPVTAADYIKAQPPVKHRVSNVDPPTKCAICGQTHGLGDLNAKPAGK